ncbi:uncharacterized protein PHA67_001568 [Liasis olivaceus]
MLPRLGSLERDPEERLQKGRAFQLQSEFQNILEKSEQNGKEVKIAELEERLDSLNKDFLQLTQQASMTQKEEELLDQELRTLEQSALLTSLDALPREEPQHFFELLELCTLKRDQHLLLEVKKKFIAQQIKDVESKLAQHLNLQSSHPSAAEARVI